MYYALCQFLENENRTYFRVQDGKITLGSDILNKWHYNYKTLLLLWTLKKELMLSFKVDNDFNCVFVYMCVSPGGWSVWGQWAQCSSECGGGIQTRARTCQSPPDESFLCEGVVEEGRPCNSQSCTGKAFISLHIQVLPWGFLFFRSAVKNVYVGCLKCLFISFICLCTHSL